MKPYLDGLRYSEIEAVIDAVSEAQPLSDQPPEGLKRCAHAFIAAHQQNPGGISLEVGTRRGGSALLFLRLLEHLYPDPATRPPLFTIDPYGLKPYKGGDVGNDGKGFGLYGPSDYALAKKALAGFANHFHFPLTSADFLCFMRGLKFWWNGKETYLASKGGTTFAFLDGDHDANTIRTELSWLIGDYGEVGTWHCPYVLVDNFDKDPRTYGEVDKFWEIAALHGNGGVQQAVILKAKER